jgi:hypothetical protein
MKKTKDQSGFRIDSRILSILLLVAIAPLLLGSWWLFRSYENAYIEMVGLSLSQAADTALGSINSYLQNQIIQTAVLAESPVLLDEVQKANLDLKKDLNEIRKSIPKMEAEWQAMKADDPKLRDILDNAASRYLNRYSELNPAFTEIIVTDFLGRLVAASKRVPGYYYATKDWWKEVYGDGIEGTVYLGDATFDRKSGSLVMELAQPIVEAKGGVIGEIKVTLGVQTINSIIGTFRALGGATAVLMRSKGEVISAPGYNPFEWKTYPPTFEILAAREKGKPYFVSNASPSAIFGLAQTNFQQMYPHLNWMLVTTGTKGEILDPLNQLNRYFIYLVIAVMAACLIATLILSREESRPLVEQDPHLEEL